MISCSDDNTSTITRLMEEQTQAVQSMPQATDSVEPAETRVSVYGESIEDIDIDLTLLGPTMVSAQVFWMMISPEEFLGQTVRVRGSYYTFFWYEANKPLHFIVLDLTPGCCGQAFEFILPYNIVADIGYIPENAVIEIVGVFTNYEMFGNLFHYLAVHEIIVE